eukprot:COSAG05_NODE_531_length_8898_cov_364.672690_5_plen_53_part_00
MRVLSFRCLLVQNHDREFLLRVSYLEIYQVGLHKAVPPGTLADEPLHSGMYP